MEALDPSRLARRVLAGARCILATAGGVERLDPDHYRVAGVRGAAAVRVYRRGDGWRCSSDRRHHAKQPCAHILAVLETVGAVRLPASVSPVAEAERRQAVELEALRLLPTRLPVLLERMLAACPAAVPPPPSRGRPCASRVVMLRQALTRALRGVMQAEPSVSRATMRHFMTDADTADLWRSLLAWTLAAARPQDTTRPDAWNRGVLPFTTPTGPLVMAAAWTPRYGLLARLDAMPAEPVLEAPGAEEAARRFAGLVGLDVASHHATAQGNEALCMAVAYNLARLVVLDVESRGSA